MARQRFVSWLQEEGKLHLCHAFRESGSHHTQAIILAEQQSDEVARHGAAQTQIMQERYVNHAHFPC